MLEKKITFKASKDYIENNKDILPIPAKQNVPDWFKKLTHSTENFTVKGCLPFLDTLTSGYILKMPIDYGIEHNVVVDGEKKTGFKSSQTNTSLRDTVNINCHGDDNFHGTNQIKNSPLLNKNCNLPVHKILNPWVIKTPPGYSTLFVPPLNNTDDRFSIIPGIVDTDTFNVHINFPFIVNGDKYPYLKTVLKRGLPYVQIIPFKRDRWKMKVEKISVKTLLTNKTFFELNVFNTYKNKYWNKKSWK